MSALRAVADRFDAIAQLAADAGPHLRFGAEVAGRAHAVAGAAVRRGLERGVVETAAWARAAQEIAVGLRCGADRFASTERDVAGGIG